VVVLAFGGLGVLIWHQWANTKHPEDSWLDPEQPAGILDSTPEVAPTRARQRSYPGSVSSWGCSKVGDC